MNERMFLLRFLNDFCYFFLDVFFLKSTGTSRIAYISRRLHGYEQSAAAAAAAAAIKASEAAAAKAASQGHAASKQAGRRAIDNNNIVDDDDDGTLPAPSQTA